MTGRRTQGDEQAQAAESPSLDEQIERASKENELLKLQVEQRKLRTVLDDLDRKAMPARKEL